MAARFIILLALATLAFGDMMRKSIVFDMKTPKVFFCPQEKPTDMSKMIVQSKPLDKLCEFEGKGIPKGYHSDCYNDIDESDYACAEKERIMMRLSPPNDTDATTTMIPTPDAPEYIKVNKKATSPANKKAKKQ